MARPRKIDSPEEFLATEVRIAGNISEGNMKMLRRGRLFPEPIEPSGGKNGYGLYDIEAVKHAAVIGAIMRGGAELIGAARLAKEIVDQFKITYGEFLDNSAYFIRAKEAPRPGKALPGDIVLAIADRRYVFIDVIGGKLKIKTLSPAGGVVDHVPEFLIEGWERGGAMGIWSIQDLVPCTSDPAFKSEYGRIEREFLDGRQNAVALLQINLSLACRNALDAIDARRAQTQSPQS